MNRSDATRHDVPGQRASAEKPKAKEGHRETVEAIVVAMILALLVRGFEAEAFVIPTGSMAPTLMGRHKEVACPQCGYVYAVNASAEDDSHSLGIAGFRLNSNAQGRTSGMVVAGTCVNCRFKANLAGHQTFNGDRILVMKFPYDMPNLPGSSSPSRWDVVVFRYPEDPEISYIKRLVGLPGEVLRVWFGDVYIKPPGESEFRLERKPLKHQRAMAMMVYDDRHRAKSLEGKPEWARWRSSEASAAWSETQPGTFDVSVPEGQDAELRYHHIVPDPEQWEAIYEDTSLPRAPRATLITDFYSYNTSQSSQSRGDFGSSFTQPHWVGDLILSSKVQVAEAKGTLRFELVEGGVVNRCEFDLANDKISLQHGSKTIAEKPSAGAIAGPGSYEILFANVDDRLTVVVNGSPIFGEGVEYDDASGSHALPTDADLAPAAIRVTGTSVTASDLVLKRDIYYTLNPGTSDYWPDHSETPPSMEILDYLADPSRLSFLSKLPSKDYPIGEDRFLMLGDNSPQSKDSRGWSDEDRRKPEYPIDHPNAGWDESNRASWEVPRNLLTGKAFFVYWPHGKPFGPELQISRDFRIPFRPYFERMKWIR
jgi:signal peptidase I